MFRQHFPVPSPCYDFLPIKIIKLIFFNIFYLSNISHLLPISVSDGRFVQSLDLVSE